ncbi:MAG: DNA phosphorothioation system sulfurtransferase DndC, partial [Thaumarchaeota archaeon]|nr:DNA phosphorothioation system sulfurtransferase DndC [Nitrososphaerota archaeon]
MSESILEKKSFAEIFEEIRTVYLNDNRPWIIGFSGGKDSTCMVQLVWNALSALPAEKLTKKIYIISSNTLVEAPQIAERITDSLDRMEKNAAKIGLPIGTNLLRPKTEDTFWVRLLGLGYPAPTTMFRWCTDMLKISNADRFIQETVSKHGEAIVLLGTRKSESVVRKESMNTYKIDGSVLSRHSQFDQTFVYTPIEDFSSEDVWNYLLENQNPWGEENRDLLAMYQNANASECPLVIDTTTPSCGGGRFGCWTCTVVDDQSYLTNLIDNDEKNEWMIVLAELRQKLKDTQNSTVWEKYRERKRR